MKEDTDLETIRIAIHVAIKKQVDEQLKIIIEEAKDAISRALYAEADKIALSVLAQYNIYRHQDEIQITVKKI